MNVKASIFPAPQKWIHYVLSVPFNYMDMKIANTKSLTAGA